MRSAKDNLCHVLMQMIKCIWSWMLRLLFHKYKKIHGIQILYKCGSFCVGFVCPINKNKPTEVQKQTVQLCKITSKKYYTTSLNCSCHFHFAVFTYLFIYTLSLLESPHPLQQMLGSLQNQFSWRSNFFPGWKALKPTKRSF